MIDPRAVWLIVVLLSVQVFLTAVLAAAAVASVNAGQEMGQGVRHIACELNRAYC